MRWCHTCHRGCSMCFEVVVVIESRYLEPLIIVFICPSFFVCFHSLFNIFLFALLEFEILGSGLWLLGLLHFKETVNVSVVVVKLEICLHLLSSLQRKPFITEMFEKLV